MMKFMTLYKQLVAVLIAWSLLGIGNSQASSSFNSQATLDFTINNIANVTNPGDLSGLAILGSFTQAGSPTSYLSVTGDGSLVADNPDFVSLPVTLGSPLVSTFAVNGNVSDGTVDSSTAGWYTLMFNNSSATDDYNVNLTLAYNLLANVGGQFADSDVIVDAYSDSNPSLGSDFINASMFALQNAVANNAFPQFTLDIAPGTSLGLYVDVTVRGDLQASPVPLPAAIWSFLAGLLSILRLNKSKSSSGASC